MKAVIYHSVSKNQRCRNIAKDIDGDHFEIKGTKKYISFVPLQMVVYGFKTVTSSRIKLVELNIDFDKYDEITLVCPVWADRVNAFVRQFLQNNKFKNKKITIIGSCDGGYNKYFDSFDKYIDDSNEIVEKIIYVKGIQE